MFSLCFFQILSNTVCWVGVLNAGDGISGVPREKGEEGRFLPTLVYDARTSMAAEIAVENQRIQCPYLGGIAVGMDLERVRKAQYLQCELKPIDHRVGVILIHPRVSQGVLENSITN